MESCIIFVPDDVKPTKASYLIGHFERRLRCSIFYVCDCLFFSVNSTILDSDSVIGRVTVDSSDVCRKKRNWLTMELITTEIEVTEVLIDNRCLPLKICRFISYDMMSFLHSELFVNMNMPVDTDYFKKLAYHVKIQRSETMNLLSPQMRTGTILNTLITVFVFLSTIFSKLFFLFKYSQFALHLQSSVEGVVWVLRSYREEGKINLQAGNYLAAVFVDIIFGSAIVSILTSHYRMNEIFFIISSCTQDVLQSILIIIEWLMGSPVGLKLNAPLNQIIGGFFLYHVKLWWTFLELVEPVLHYGVHIIVNLGVLGLTFQAALVLDLLVIATFHVYCIYVYAARLYGWHISGLLSLSKLVLGRKRNPVPGRVDSCPYTTEQLFVGTISFAVLLFLLPTLLVYYIVFAFMRIGVVVFSASIMNLIYYLRIIPLYSTFSWLFDSKRTATTVRLTVKRSSGMVKQHIRAESLSWNETISICIPSVVSPPCPLPWAELASHLSTGKLIFPV